MEQTLQRGLSMDKKRDSFTFQRYYFEAISTLKSKEKLELYDAICEYVFEGKNGSGNITDFGRNIKNQYPDLFNIFFSYNAPLL